MSRREVIQLVQGVLSTADLLAATGYTSAGALRRSLDAQGVPYFLGKDGAPWTTLELLNAAKLDRERLQADERFSCANL